MTLSLYSGFCVLRSCCTFASLSEPSRRLAAGDVRTQRTGGLVGRLW